MSLWEKLFGNPVVTSESVTCHVPKEALGPAKKLDNKVPDTIDAVILYLLDGTTIKKIIDCPYYRLRNLSNGELVYGCLPIEAPEDLKKTPKNLKDILPKGYNGCPCKYGREIPNLPADQEE